MKKNGANLLFAYGFIDRLFKTDSTRIDNERKRLGLKEVFATMIAALTSNDPEAPAKRRRFDPSSTATSGYYSTKRWTLSENDIARMVDICIATNLKDEEGGLLDKMMLDASNADARTLEVVFMDFLRVLRRIMLEHNISFGTKKHQDTFQYIIQTFVAEFVGMEPMRPENYAGDATKKSGCNSSACRDCKDLDYFCQNIGERMWELKATEARRNHVGSQISGSRRFWTEFVKRPQGAPHILRVHKTQYEMWQTDHNDWLQRCTKAKNIMDDNGHDALRELLADKYEEYVHLQSVKRGPTTVIPERPSPRMNGRTQVIDLSEH